MLETAIERYYPITSIDFGDLWDLAKHFQSVHTPCSFTTYTVEVADRIVIREESDVSYILRELNGVREPITAITAEFFDGDDDFASSKLVYRAIEQPGSAAGVYFNSATVRKMNLVQFEEMLVERYQIDEEGEVTGQFGEPCEVVCAIIDMRGFSVFCEKPNIESPYTCGLMTAFYHIVNQSLNKYPPDLIKFAGDGVLAIWRTTIEDRDMATKVCVDGLVSLQRKWQVVRRSPHFSHGAPSDIGAGVSFGLASKISVLNDYIGRPINLAARLCGVCPGGRVYVDTAVPNIPSNYEKREVRVRIKSFGEYTTYMLFAAAE